MILLDDPLSLRHYLANAMKDNILIFVLLLLGVVVWSCREDEGTFSYDPSIEAKFINQDSAKQLQDDTLKVLSDSLAVLNAELDQYEKEAQDTAKNIAALKDSIADGKLEYQAELDANIAARDKLKVISDSLERSLDKVSELNAYWKKVLSGILNGKLLVNRIVNRGNELFVSYEDSVNLWRIPLSQESSSVLLNVEIGGRIYAIDIAYELRTVVDDDDYIIREPYRLSVESDPENGGFDSLKVSCKSDECLASETSVIFYF